MVTARLRIAGLAVLLLGLTALLVLQLTRSEPKPRMSADPCRGREIAPGDWAGLCQYAARNRAALASGQAVEAVFIGDSLTAGWAILDPAMFGPQRLARGIPGQTSQHVLVRFRQDVVALRPRVVHLMVGLNDISGLTGPMRPEDTLHDIAAMADIAKANGIAVVIGSLTPAKAFPWRKGLDPRPEIAELNRRLAAMAAERELVFADYHAVLAAPDGSLDDPSAADTVHLGLDGFRRIRPIAERALAEALERQTRRQR